MKLEIESVKFKNFFSFGNKWQELEFKNGLNLILGYVTEADRSNKILNTINWALTVQQVYLQIKNEINIITSVEDLNNIDISYEWFEERYGINGTILADPDLRTEKLFESE